MGSYALCLLSAMCMTQCETCHKAITDHNTQMCVSYKVAKLGVGVGALGLALVEVKADRQNRLGQGGGVRLGDGGHGGGGGTGELSGEPSEGRLVSG